MRILDFAQGSPAWRSIDDVVMGGVSSSEMLIENDVAVFRGRLSLDRGGGFASVRSLPGSYDLSAYSGLVVRLRGDGHRYAFRLRDSAALDSVSYQLKLTPEDGVWQEIYMPFSDFEAVFRGRPVANHAPLDPAGIISFGLLIADRQEGPFRIEMAWIEGVRRS